MEPDPDCEHKKYSLIDRFNKLYELHPPFQDFINFQSISIPASFPDALHKIKLNSIHFAFYYISIYFIFNILYFFLNRFLIIPFTTFFIAYYLISNEFIIFKHTLQKYQIIIGCIVLNIFFILFSKSYFLCIISFFALNGFISMIIIAHTIIMDQQLEGQESEI